MEASDTVYKRNGKFGTYENDNVFTDRSKSVKILI
jgi:hypothetical protein